MTAIEIVEFMREQNPYPADIFIEPTHEQYEAFNEHLKQFGLTPDAYNGSMGRRAWDNCCREILRCIEEELGDE